MPARPLRGPAALQKYEWLSVLWKKRSLGCHGRKTWLSASGIFYPKFWILTAAPGIKLGTDEPASSRYFLADSLLGDCPDG